MIKGRDRDGGHHRKACNMPNVAMKPRFRTTHLVLHTPQNISPGLIFRQISKLRGRTVLAASALVPLGAEHNAKSIIMKGPNIDPECSRPVEISYNARV